MNFMIPFSSSSFAFSVVSKRNEGLPSEIVMIALCASLRLFLLEKFLSQHESLSHVGETLLVLHPSSCRFHGFHIFNKFSDEYRLTDGAILFDRTIAKQGDSNLHCFATVVHGLVPL